MYFVWQNLDWEDRQVSRSLDAGTLEAIDEDLATNPRETQDIYGTSTMNNRPPSRNATLNDVLDMSPLSEIRPLRELIDTIGDSPFCFVYE